MCSCWFGSAPLLRSSVMKESLSLKNTAIERGLWPWASTAVRSIPLLPTRKWNEEEEFQKMANVKGVQLAKTGLLISSWLQSWSTRVSTAPSWSNLMASHNRSPLDSKCFSHFWFHCWQMGLKKFFQVSWSMGQSEGEDMDLSSQFLLRADTIRIWIQTRKISPPDA